MNDETIKQAIDKMDAASQAQAKKLSKLELIRVTKATQQIYNHACSKCQAGLYQKQISQYSQLCDTCKHDNTIIGNFKKLQDIHQRHKQQGV